MKRFFSLLLAVMMVSLFSVSAFAADSISGVVEIAEAVDAQGNAVTLTITDSADDPTIPELTLPIAAEISNQSENSLAILWTKDISSDILPVTITFHVAGTDGLMLYLYHFNGTEWVIEESGIGPDITVTFTSLSPVAVVVQSSGSGDVSPKTDASGWMYGLCGTAAAAAMIVGTVTLRKRED